MLKKCILDLMTFVTMSVFCFFQAGALSFEEFAVKSQPKSAENDIREVFVPPANNNDSIQYSLFTRSNPKKPCFIEPNPEEFDHCPFDPNLDTKILIYGFLATVKTYKSFALIKDVLLKQGSYNVIYVHWSRYNGHPYPLAKENTILVGKKVAEFIKFIKKHTRARFRSFHLIGHSLGAHMSGIVGKNVFNLGRITGLDPAGQLYELDNKNDQLFYTDAKFVDVIHTSDELTGQGFGKYEPMGHMDFYPNGGRIQMEACNKAEEANASGDILTKPESLFNVTNCNHVMSIKFFLNSILNCDYLSTKCDDYENPPICSSKGNPTARMGFFAKPIKGLPVKSKFFLRTSGKRPFC